MMETSQLADTADLGGVALVAVAVAIIIAVIQWVTWQNDAPNRLRLPGRTHIPRREMTTLSDQRSPHWWEIVAAERHRQNRERKLSQDRS